MKFPFTRKIWEIFLSQAKSAVKVLFISESLENRLPVVNFICRWVITGWVKALFFLLLLLFSVLDGFSIFFSAFAFSDAPALPFPFPLRNCRCFVLELIQKWTILIVQQCYPNTMLWAGLRWKSACNPVFIIFSKQFGNGPHLTMWSWLWHLPWARAKSDPAPLSVLLFIAQ